MPPDPTLGLQHFERPPQRPSADADLRRQDAFGRKALLALEGAAIQEGPQAPQGEVGTIQGMIRVGHRIQFRKYRTCCGLPAIDTSLRGAASRRNNAILPPNQFATGSVMVR